MKLQKDVDVDVDRRFDLRILSPDVSCPLAGVLAESIEDAVERIIGKRLDTEGVDKSQIWFQMSVQVWISDTLSALLPWLSLPVVYRFGP